MNSQLYPRLSQIQSPEQLRELDEPALQEVADELRRYLIESVAVSGGHFGAGLGCVELTVALHYVYETPWDRVVWDVGHQAYAHKLITGRRDQFETVRQHGGLSGFTRRSESPYDAFSTGHSSTSISASLGIAHAKYLKKEKSKPPGIFDQRFGFLCYEPLSGLEPPTC